MKCPNCNGEIGRFELAPDCKHCGVNIFYSQQEKLLAEDAKKCELEYASFRILTAKIKCAFIGGALQIMRIVAMVAAIGIIFIPFVRLSASLPLFESVFSLGAFGIYQAFSGGELMLLLNLSGYIPSLFAATIALCALFLLVFLMGLGVFAALVLSFINIKKTARISCVFAALGAAFSVAAAVMSFVLPRFARGTFVNVQPGVGAIFCVAVFVLIFVLNLMVIKKGIAPDIKDVDLQRVEMRRKVKLGEVSLDSLPLPVFESEEEKTKRIEAEEKSRKLVEKAKDGEHSG